MKSEDLPEEKLNYLNCAILCRYGIEVSKLGQSVNHYIDTVIQVDISGHPPFPAGSKQISSNFDNLLFLIVFRLLNFWSRFEALNDVFWGILHVQLLYSLDRSFQWAIMRLKRRSYAKVMTLGS